MNTLKKSNIGKDNSFSKLVRDIDKKWGHTYEEVKENDWDLDNFMKMITPLNDNT